MSARGGVATILSERAMWVIAILNERYDIELDSSRAARDNGRAFAPVAQLDRVPGFEPGCREFESLRAHHPPTPYPSSPKRLCRIKRLRRA